MNTTAAELEKQEQNKSGSEPIGQKIDPKALLKKMVEAGVHLGHQTRFWNPKMRPYLHGQRNGVYIIDLAKTITNMFKAAAFLKKQAAMGRNIIFVGTTRQVTELIKQEAERSGSCYINQRWLGGLITNFETVRMSLGKLRDLEVNKDGGLQKGMTKKEIAKENRLISKLNKSLGGLKKMRGRPEVLVVVDQIKDNIAIREAVKAGAKVVSIVDSNCDPTGIDFPIPANDDSIRSVRLITQFFADAIAEGRQAKK